jgi:hypothetical protein
MLLKRCSNPDKSKVSESNFLCEEVSERAKKKRFPK